MCLNKEKQKQFTIYFFRRKIDLTLPDGKTSKLVIATRTANGYTLEFGDQSLEVSVHYMFSRI